MVIKIKLRIYILTFLVKNYTISPIMTVRKFQDTQSKNSQVDVECCVRIHISPPGCFKCKTGACTRIYPSRIRPIPVAEIPPLFSFLLLFSLCLNRNNSEQRVHAINEKPCALPIFTIRDNVTAACLLLVTIRPRRVYFNALTQKCSTLSLSFYELAADAFRLISPSEFFTL